MTSKIFTVQVTMTVRKDYTVRAKDEGEAVTLLQQAGIVSTELTSGVGDDEYYREDYEVVGISANKKPDVE
jgi:hypothetical protein